MSDPITAWLANFISSTRLLNTQGGFVYAFLGAVSTLATNAAAEPPAPHWWYASFYTPLAIFGIGVMIADQGRIHIAPWFKARQVERKNQKLREATGKVAWANLDSVTQDEAMALLLLLNLPSPRISGPGRNRMLESLQFRNFIHESKWEDGIYSADTYVVDAYLWERREEIKKRFADVPMPKELPSSKNSWMA
ncbi:hypothetical protein ELI30_19775 [Rhizobium leguminosarum]|uniref:hypothetical protein n=1 Tax=Rhizobium leguminosarum TaxID=384 RepID=UPI00103006B9|nr:hypothetical protein [Rhizobium leguminosarum]TAV50392.1 hypothetical protein ELI32_20475 [Rhizobium leguminosarum]TAV59754.1 hypothetical protein ELI31_19000 [Rhizobium leguminosarum]TAV70802.1 hypothetical protein ELI30_19775 [Rhizobium leguminosarum]TAY68421.1 hypothetical protein ELH82_20665 [Rhizobium leguminosarum]